MWSTVKLVVGVALLVWGHALGSLAGLLLMMTAIVLIVPSVAAIWLHEM